MMAGKDTQSPTPLVSGSGDAEARAAQYDPRELRRKKWIKYSLYLVGFVIFQTAVIAIFVATIMKVRTPKFRVRSATFDVFNVDPSKPSFNLTMRAHLDVKNANFGKYKYEETPVNLFYGPDRQIGKVVIPKSSVGWRSTKKLNNVVITLNSDQVGSNSGLGDDLNKTGVLRIRSSAEMKGKVRLTFIFNKKKSVKMDCSMDIVVAQRQLVNISCH